MTSEVTYKVIVQGQIQNTYISLIWIRLNSKRPHRGLIDNAISMRQISMTSEFTFKVKVQGQTENVIQIGNLWYVSQPISYHRGRLPPIVLNGQTNTSFAPQCLPLPCYIKSCKCRSVNVTSLSKSGEELGNPTLKVRATAGGTGSRRIIRVGLWILWRVGAGG